MAILRRQSYWCNIASGEELFPEELIQIILQQERGAVVLDGYSGCGKTYYYIEGEYNVSNFSN